MSLAGLTVAYGLHKIQPPTVHHDLRSMAKNNPIGTGANNNGGITWFGSQFTGPGNIVAKFTRGGGNAINNTSSDSITAKLSSLSLPRTPNDWNTLEHDVDYHNTQDKTKDAIWQLDKKAIEGALRVSDPYGGNVATAVGLVFKNALERTHEAITGSSEAIYPNSSFGDRIPWFDVHPSIRRRTGPPPPQRPNWKSLNKGQKLYAIKQYNVGRRRRGLPELNYDNLTVLGAAPQDSVESSDWEHGLESESIGSDNVFEDEPTAGPSGINSEQSTSAEPHVDTVIKNPSANHRMANVTSGIKRAGGADSTSPGHGYSTQTKRPKTSGMDLPLTGGSNPSDLDTGNPSIENSVIPRPLDSISGHKLVFRKNHSFLSYGLAWKISRLNATSEHYLTTTSLMSIPVEQPYLYLSPAEFHWVEQIRGVRVINLNVKVVMRNPRTAFETNSSTTTLATLNQNKFICLGHGLNIKTRGIDRFLKFGSGGDAMLHTGTEEYGKKHMEDFIKASYGSTTHHPELNHEGMANLPCSALLLPILNNRYFCTVGTHSDVNKDLGWPNLSKYITKSDASFLTGRTVADYTYEPKMGFLSQPFQMRLNGFYGNESDASFNKQEIVNITKRSGLLGSVVQTTTKSGTKKQSNTEIADVKKDEWSKIAKKFGTHYYTPIEKSQYLMRGRYDQHTCHVQPSLHLGIYPVPRMTTSELSVVPSKYTDVEVQWDITTSMELSFGFETMELITMNRIWCPSKEQRICIKLLVMEKILTSKINFLPSTANTCVASQKHSNQPPLPFRHWTPLSN